MKSYFAFQWHITDDCDQRCRHCYIFAEDTCKKLDTMTWEQMKEVLFNIEDFCEMYTRAPYIYLTGGDPILHPEFWPLLELLAMHHIPFTIMGNPFHLTERVCERMHLLGCEKYQLSIDGLEKTHDWFRKPGSYRETLAKIPLINASGMRSVVMTTVSGTNIDEVPGIMDVAVEAGTYVYAFARYCPTSEEKDTGMTPQRYRELLDTLDAKIKAYEAEGCDTYFNRKDHLWTLYQYEKGEFLLPEGESGMIYGGCNCGNCHLTILPSGDVYACRRVQNSRVGNALEDRLADLWVAEMEAYREYDRFSKCAKCELLPYCRGCPAVASGASGDFYAPDPQCWKQVNCLTGERLLEG
ncbi:MAG: radical SAM/SPASM domain protein, ACGX system [Clostridia bacterium]|nr:radical SAM/SPASM domain protein, ACGX system [Clostridia bacterium]